MARISSEGTFVYCKGSVILDSWSVDCEGGDVLTQTEVLRLVVKFLHAKLVEVPELQAKLEALKAVQRAQGDGGDN